MRRSFKSSIDRRRLATESHLREELATASGDRLRATPASGSSIGDAKTAFTANIMKTVGRVVPPQERRRWDVDAQSEVELSCPMATRRAAWKQERTDKQDTP